MAKNNSSTNTYDEWPGAFSIFNDSKRAVMKNIGPLLIVGLVYVALSIFGSVFIKNDTAEQIVNNLASIILGPVFTLILLMGIDDKKIDFADAFKKSLVYIVPYFIVSVLVGIALIGSLIALIVPFFFVLPRLALAQYYVIDKNLNAVDAFKASWNDTKGHSAKVWGIIGASIVMLLPVFTIIGIPIAIVLLFLYSAAFPILYRYVIKHKVAA